MKNIEFRIYPDGSVIHEDDFEETDFFQDASDDYSTHEVPEDIIIYLEENY